MIQKLDGWIYHLDDDNLLHENFYKKIGDVKITEKTGAIIFSQKVGGIDFSGVDVRYANPKKVKVGKIDLAQWIIHSSLHKGNLYGSGYTADGEFIEKLYK